jgi:transcription initiation factor TFIID subunit TAF12
MNRINGNVLDSLERAIQYLTDHPVAPANTQVTALTTQLQGVIVTMTNHRNRQDLGLGKFTDGSVTKAEAATELRRQMKRISKIGKELDPIQFPNLRQTLRMPNKGYQGLQSRAETFVTTVTPIKATFADRGLPADFDEQLQDAIDAFEAATQRQSTGRAQRVQGTKGLSVTASKGRKIVRAIDSILFALYDDEPDLYAAWKSASRVEDLPSPAQSATTPPAATAAPAAPAAPAQG